MLLFIILKPSEIKKFPFHLLRTILRITYLMLLFEKFKKEIMNLNTAVLWFHTGTAQSPCNFTNACKSQETLKLPSCSLWLFEPTVTLGKTVVGEHSVSKIIATVCNQLLISPSLKYYFENGLFTFIYHLQTDFVS